MSTVNPLAREISAKIVYYGPGLSGKTTTLQRIHTSVAPETRGQLISLATEGDRTLFFDFLPLRIEPVRGLTLRLQLYTVPGQVFYDATRKLVLNGADGVVFVADSQEAARDSNAESLSNLETNLAELGIELRHFPLVLQYNKRDLPTALPVAALRRELNPFGVPELESVASRGDGVLETLREITRLVVAELKARPPQRTAAAAMELSDGGSELASRISSMADEPQQDEPGAVEPKPVESKPVESKPAEPKPAEPEPVEPKPVDAQPAEPRAEARPADPERRAGDGFSFGRLCPATAGAIAEVERALRDRAWAAALRVAERAVNEILAALPVEDTRSSARASLLGVDGREFLRLGRLAQKKDAAVTEVDALFALYLLVAASVKAERI